MSHKRFLIVDELIIAIKKMNTRQPYTIPQRNLLLLSTVLVVIGSSVPREIEGDFVSTWRYGVRLFPVFADNGGVIVSLLGILIVGLVFRSEVFVKHPVK